MTVIHACISRQNERKLHPHAHTHSFRAASLPFPVCLSVSLSPSLLAPISIIARQAVHSVRVISCRKSERTRTGSNSSRSRHKACTGRRQWHKRKHTLQSCVSQRLYYAACVYECVCTACLPHVHVHIPGPVPRGAGSAADDDDRLMIKLMVSFLCRHCCCCQCRCHCCWRVM